MSSKKEIEQITDEDLSAIWPVIGGTPHLFDFGKDELKTVLITGFGPESDSPEPIGLQLDFYTMAAIVDILRNRGFETPDYVSML